MTGSSFHTAFGGKGANQSVMAAHLGAHVTLIAHLGNDGFGRDQLRNLQTQGVDTRFVTVDDRLPSGASLILVEEATGRNTIGWAPGASGALSPDLVRAARDAIVRADVLTCELEVPPAATLEACRIAHGARPRRPMIVLNAAPISASPVPDELLRLADVLVVNEDEASWIAGSTEGEATDAAGIARVLTHRWGGATVITLGARGVVWASPDGASHAWSAPPVPAVDTTGAGDAFVGALACQLGSGRALGPAVASAAAVASWTVSREGAQSSYPTLEDVHHLLVGSAPLSRPLDHPVGQAPGPRPPVARRP
jgi:ribokinase